MKVVRINHIGRLVVGFCASINKFSCLKKLKKLRLKRSNSEMTCLDGHCPGAENPERGDGNRMNGR